MKLEKRLEKLLTQTENNVTIHKAEVETIYETFRRFASKLVYMQIEDMEESEIYIAEVLVRYGFLEEDVETTWEDGHQYNWKQYVLPSKFKTEKAV